MKIFFNLLIMIIIASCTKTPNKSNENENTLPETNISDESLVIDSNDENDSFYINFPTILSRDSYKVGRRIYFSNKTFERLTINDLKSEIEGANSSFEVKKDTCSNENLSVGKICYIDVYASFSQNLDGNYEFNITGNDSSTSPKLFLFISTDAGYYTENNNSLDTLKKSTSVLNFGTISRNENSSSQRIYFFNENYYIALTAPSLGPLPDNFSITKSTCIGFLLRKSSCFIDIRYDYKEEANSDELINENIVINSSYLSEKNITLLGLNLINSEYTSQQKLISSQDTVKFPINLKPSRKYYQRVYLANILNDNIEISDNFLQDSFSDSEFVIRKNNCSAIKLKTDRYCYFDLELTTGLEPIAIREERLISGANMTLVIEAGDPSQLSDLLASNYSFSTEINSYVPLSLNYEDLIKEKNSNYDDVNYEIIESTLLGDYTCFENRCFYTANTIGNFYMILKATKISDETEATSRIDIEVFGSENVPEFATVIPQTIFVEQGGVVNFTLESATSGSDEIIYELVDFPTEGILDSCLNTLLTDGNTDISCRYQATGELFSTRFTYKAVNSQNSKFAIKEVQISILDSDTVLDVFPGLNGSLALNDNGSIFGKGLNNSKMFGIDADYRTDSFVFDQNNAIKVPLKDKVEKLFVKGDSAIAKLRNGEYYAWGNGLKSRLAIQKTATTGTGYFIYKPEKITIFENQNLDFAEITINENSTCGLTEVGEVYCWGSNQNGELGYDFTTQNYGKYQPTKVSFGLNNQGIEKKASKIAISSVGATHHCAIVENEGYCWGQNDSGQLGIGKTSQEIPTTFNPTKISLNENIKEIAIGERVTCAINFSNELKCWGKNDYGQLGQGNQIIIGETDSQMASINPINLGSGIYAQKVYIGAGGSSVCSIMDNSKVKCWGRNDLGQLGLNDFDNRGDNINEMGDNLSYLKDGLNVDFVAAFIRESGKEDFCLRSNIDQKVFCWGNNSNKSISQITPYVPAIGTEYSIQPGDSAPYLANNAIEEYTFHTVLNSNKDLSSDGFTAFKDLYTENDEILYFIKPEGVNIYNGIVYSKNDPQEIAGRLPLECLSGINESEMRSCTFSPEQGFIGEFIIKYEACSANLKCSDSEITLKGRVLDPNNPYFENEDVLKNYQITRYQELKFELDLPRDPQNKYNGVISINNTVQIGPNNNFLVYSDEGKIAGVISGCALAQSENFVGTQYGHYPWRYKDCKFRPKENFKTSAYIEYQAINSDGYRSEVRRLEFLVDSNRTNSLSVIGSRDNQNLVKRSPELYNNTWYASTYLAVGGSDNSLAPSSNKDPYPTNINALVIENLDTSINPRSGYPEEKETEKAIQNIISMDRDETSGNICSLKDNGEIVCWGDFSRYQALGAVYTDIKDNYNVYISAALQERHKIANISKDGFINNAKSVQAGAGMSCAIVGDNNEVVCWGSYAYGCGETIPRENENRGFPCQIKKEDNTLLSNIKSIELNPYSACALSNDDKLYCWGYKLNADGNSFDNTRTYSSYVETELQDSLNYNNKAKEISLGSKIPVKISSSDTSVCLSYTDNTVSCMGYKKGGYSMPFLSQASSTGFYDMINISEITDVDPETLSLNIDTACYLSLDNKLKCWGTNHASMYKPNSAQISGVEEIVIPSVVLNPIEIVQSRSNICLKDISNKYSCWGQNSYFQNGNINSSALQNASEVGFLQEQPNIDLVANQIILTNNNTYVLTDSMIENDEWYQTEFDIIASGENSSLNFNLFGDNTPEAFTLLKKPDYGLLGVGEIFGDITYTPNRDVSDNSVFDKLTYILNSDKEKVYTVWFRTDKVSSEFEFKDFTMSVIDNTSVTIYNSNLLKDQDNKPLGFKILNFDSLNIGTSTCSEEANVTGYNYYCTINIAENKAGQVYPLVIEASDGTVVKTKTYNLNVFENNKPLLTEGNQNYLITPYEKLAFEPSKAIYGLNYNLNTYEVVSGIVNDSGTIKVFDVNGIEAGLLNSCKLGTTSNTKCIFTPYVDYVGNILIEYQAKSNTGELSEITEISIEVSKDNLNNLPFAIGYTSYLGLYEKESFLYRLQGGSNPSIRNGESYPVPYIFNEVELSEISTSQYGPSENTEKLVNSIIDIDAKRYTPVCMVESSGQVKCAGSKTASGGYFHNWYYGGSEFVFTVFDYKYEALNSVKEVTSGASQSCAVVGSNNEAWCWGKTKGSVTTNNSSSSSQYPSSGCGSLDSLTRNGLACPIVLENEIKLTNVKKINTKDGSTCAIIEELNKDEIYCWGERLDNEGLGGNSIDTTSQTNHLNYAEKLVNNVDGLRFTDIVFVSNKNICATASDDRVYCAGASSYNERLTSGNNPLKDIIVDFDLSNEIGIVKNNQPIKKGNRASFKIGPFEESDNTSTLLISSTNDSSPGYILTEEVVGLDKYLNIDLVMIDNSYDISFTSNILNVNTVVSIKPIVLDSLRSDYENTWCIYSQDDNYYCSGYISSTYNYLASSVDGYEIFNRNNPTQIDLLSQQGLSSFDYSLDGRNYCYIDNNKEVYCFGSNKYAKGSYESGMNVSGHTPRILFEDRSPMLDKIDGNPIKANFLVSLEDIMVVVSESVIDINVDLRPQEKDFNSGIAGVGSLIDDIDTDKYEYFIINKPSSGKLTGDIYNLTYTPYEYFVGTDEITYRVYDKDRDYSVIKKIKLKVSDSNIKPEGEDSEYYVSENFLLNFSLKGTDKDSDSLTCEVISAPTLVSNFSCDNTNGSGCNCQYQSNIGSASSVDTLTYKLNDGTVDSEIHTVVMNIVDDINPIVSNPIQNIYIDGNQKFTEIEVSKSYGVNYEKEYGYAVYYESIIGGDTYKDIFSTEKAIVLKNNNEDIIKLTNCFASVSIPSTSSDRICDVELLKQDFVGTLEYDYIAKSNQDLDKTSSAKIIFNINSNNTPLYAFGYVSGSQRYNNIGNFETYSNFYRENGGEHGNNIISFSSDKEVHPVPVISDERIYSNVGVSDSSNTNICFSDGETNNVQCLGGTVGAGGEYGISYSGSVDNRFKNIIEFEDGNKLTNIKSISVGNTQSCAIDDNDNLACWGRTLKHTVSSTYKDRSGCGVQGGLTQNGKACYIVDNNNMKIENILQVAVDKKTDRTCYIDSLNKVYCYGYNFSGTQDDNNLNSNPVLMSNFSDKEATSLALDQGSLCVSFSDNTIRCLGYNGSDRFLTGNTSQVTSPVELDLKDINNNPVSVSADSLLLSENKACVIGTDDFLYCWGYDSYGAFSKTDEYVTNTTYKTLDNVTKIFDLTEISDFKISNYGICTIGKVDKKLYCWGYNSNGNLGNGKYIERTNPAIKGDYFDDIHYIAYDEIVPVSKIDGTPILVESVEMTSTNTYITIPNEENYLSPYKDIETTKISVSENSIINIDLTSGETGNNIFTLLYGIPNHLIKNQYGNESNYVLEFNDTSINPYLTYFSYLVQDLDNDGFTVKRYIFEVTPENDKPIYQNKTISVASGESIYINHSSIDPDGTYDFTYALVTSPSQGTINCSEEYRCLYTAPVIGELDPEVLLSAEFSVEDELGLFGDNGIVNIVVKPIPNPFFEDYLISVNGDKNIEKVYFQLLKAQDPGGLSLSYEIVNDTVKNIFDTTLNRNISAVYNAANINEVVGYIDECFIDVVDGSASKDGCVITLTKENFEGDILIQYNATNGTGSSALVSVEVNISEYTGINKLYMAGYHYLNEGGLTRNVSNEYDLDLFSFHVQEDYNEDFNLYNGKYIGNLESIVAHSTGLCYIQRNELDSDKKVYCTDFSSSDGKFGLRQSTYPPGSQYDQSLTAMRGRFTPIRDTISNQIISDDISSVNIGNDQICIIHGVDNKVLCQGSTSDYSRSTSSPNYSGCGFEGNLLKNGNSCYLKDENNQEITGVKKIVLGDKLGCLIKENNGVDNIYCWGKDLDWNNDSSRDASRVPTNEQYNNTYSSLVDGIGVLEVKDIGTYSSTVCAVLIDDSISCFGEQNTGLLGVEKTYVYSSGSKNYTVENFSIMKDGLQVSLKANSLKMNHNKACVLSTSDEMFCWGSSYGTTPVQVTIPSRSWEDYKLSSSGACLIDSIDELYCYGSNYYGQFANSIDYQVSNILPENAVKALKQDGSSIKVKDFGIDSNRIYIIEKD